MFNARLAGLRYLENRNATPTLSDDEVKSAYLTISSSEMTFLIEYFGLVVGARVPKNNRGWKLYLLLKDIMFIVYSDFFDDLLYLLDEKEIVNTTNCLRNYLKEIQLYNFIIFCTLSVLLKNRTSAFF